MSVRASGLLQSVAKRMPFWIHGAAARWNYQLSRCVINAFSGASYSDAADSQQQKLKSDFVRDHYVVLDNFLSEADALALGKRCLDAINSEKNVLRFATQTSKPSNVVLQSSVPDDYYTKQVHMLGHPSRAVPALMDEVIKPHRPFFEAALQTYFRVENLVVYETRNNGQPTYNLNSRAHTDDDPPTFVKLMVYLTDVDASNGPFTVVDKDTGARKPIYGKAGTAVLFRQNLVLHEASNTVSRTRMAAFFILMPSFYRATNVNCDFWANTPYRKYPFFPVFNRTKKP